MALSVLRSTLLASLIFVLGCSGGGSGSATQVSAVNAGLDLDVAPFETVTLSASTAAGVLTWSQTGGLAVELVDNGDGTAAFTAPRVGGSLDFSVQATDGGAVIGADAITVTVRSARRAPSFELVSRTPLFLDAAAAAAYEPESRRGFVIDEASGSVTVLDLADPEAPQRVGTLPVPAPATGFAAGAPGALAAGAGLIAVGFDNVPGTLPGRIVFYDAVSLLELGSFPCGANPVAGNFLQRFSRSRFAFACAGTPEYSVQAGGNVIDPEGAIIVVTVPLIGVGGIDPSEDIVRIDFGSLNGQREALLADGVRLPRPSASVSEDIEPRSILLNSGTFTATVGLPANNAVAQINLETGTVEKVRGLEHADFSGDSSLGSAAVRDRVLWRTGRPQVSVSAGAAGTIQIAEHDVAAIHVVESTADSVVFDAVMGRGPVRGSGSFQNGARADFYRPSLQQAVLRIRVSQATGAWTVESELPLFRDGGTPITGRPNLLASSTGLAFHDEVPFDVDDNELGLDAFGAWFTGITRVGDEIWCSDARRPSVYRFSGGGELIQRYVPAGSGAFGATVGEELLPAVYAQRWGDFGGWYFGGFHGIAATGSGEIAVLCGSPLDNPDTSFNGSAQASRMVRLLLLDANSGVPTREYAVVLDYTGQRFTDLAWVDGALHAIEEGACRGARSLVRLDLDEATNLLELGADRPAVNAGLELTDPSELATEFNVPIYAVSKSLVADLTAAGLGGGFAAAIDAQPGGGVVLASSDDFRIGAGLAALNQGGIPGSVCSRYLDGLFHADVSRLALAPRAFDPSDADGGAGLRNYPVSGLRQIVDLVGVRIQGQRGVVYAIDGDFARNTGGSAGFLEFTEARHLDLDTNVFPDPDALLATSALGPLRVSSADGDSNGDGLVESIYAFGGRSLLALDFELDAYRDLGDTMTRDLLARRPEVAPRLDAAAPRAGLRPSAGAVLGFDRLLAVAYRDAGVIGLMDISNQEAPILVSSLLCAPGGEPVDLVPFTLATTGGSESTYLAVLDRANGTLDLYREQL